MRKFADQYQGVDIGLLYEDWNYYNDTISIQRYEWEKYKYDLNYTIT